MRTVELWINAMVTTFGKTAEDHSSFPRVCKMLTTRAGLNKVFHCLKGGVKLHGNGSDEQGITECATLWKELRKLKAGGKPDADEKPAESASTEISGTEPGGLTASEACRTMTFIHIASIGR